MISPWHALEEQLLISTRQWMLKTPAHFSARTELHHRAACRDSVHIVCSQCSTAFSVWRVFQPDHLLDMCPMQRLSRATRLLLPQVAAVRRHPHLVAYQRRNDGRTCKPSLASAWDEHRASETLRPTTLASMLMAAVAR